MICYCNKEPYSKPSNCLLLCFGHQLKAWLLLTMKMIKCNHAIHLFLRRCRLRGRKLSFSLLGRPLRACTLWGIITEELHVKMEVQAIVDIVTSLFVTILLTQVCKFACFNTAIISGQGTLVPATISILSTLVN